MDKEVNTQPQYPMKWHNFLIYFLLWLSGIVNILNGYRAITGMEYEGKADSVYALFPGLKPIDIAFGIAIICFGILIIVTRFKLAGFKANGPKFLSLVYFVGSAVSIIYVIAVISTTPLTMADFGSQIISQLVINVILLTANYVYYNKRAALFVN